MKKIYTYLFLAAFAIGFSNPASAQIINTVAGSGGTGYDGDGTAVVKMLNDPWGVAVDAAQNFYITDKDNALIRKITLAGVMTTIGGKAGITAFAGDEVAATNATFNTPYGICLDAAGNIYVADGMNCRIRKIDLSGVVHTVAGFNLIGGYAGDGGPATAANLLYPTGVCIAPSGDMYIADYGNNVIRKVDAVTGNISTVAGNNTPGYSGDGGAATNAQLNNPYDVKIDASGNLLIADRYWGNIRKVTPAGIITTLYNTPARVRMLALDGSGNIFFTCENFAVYKIDAAGSSTSLEVVAGAALTAGSSGDGGLATAARFQDVAGVAIGPTGNIYIVDETNNKVREITYPVIPVLPITGTTVLCQGASDTLHDATPGGTWTSNNTAIATIDLNTGVLNGVAAGNAIITYRTSFNFATTLITITSPGSLGSAGKVLGLNYACPGKTVILTETMPGGEWTSSNTAVSTINNAGLVRAIRPGSAVLTYTIVGACGAEVSLKFPFKTLTYEECIGTAGVTTTPSAGMETTIQAWPNPNEGTFTINMESGIDEQVQVTITNVVGQKIKELTAVTNKHLDVKLDGVGGLYFINAVSEHGQWSQKVLVNASH